MGVSAKEKRVGGDHRERAEYACAAMYVLQFVNPKGDTQQDVLGVWPRQQLF